MPGPSDRSLQQFEGWNGINNVLSEVGLPTEFLRQANNVDIDDQGKPQRRAGYTQVIAGGARSLWAGRLFPYALYASANMLYAFDDPTNPQAVTTVDSVSDLSYCEVNDVVYWTDGTSLGMIDMDLAPHPPAAANPPSQPTLVATGTGGLFAGSYQVAVTHVDALGRESGTSIARVVQVAEGGGIQATFAPAVAGTVTRRIYMTSANGDVLYLYRTVPAAVSALLLGVGNLTTELRTQFLEPMPGGHLVRYYNGRLYVAQHNRVLFSRSLRYGQYDPSEGYLTFRGHIRLLHGVGEGQSGGLFVGDDRRVYFLGGPDPENFTQRTAYPFAAVEGTALTVPGSYLGLSETREVVYWLSSNGVFCVGMPDGSVMPMTERYALAPQAQSGASFIRDIAGIRQIVTNISGIGNTQVAAASDSAVARVERNGVVVQ